jgi:beta-xylosidase
MRGRVLRTPVWLAGLVSLLVGLTVMGVAAPSAFSAVRASSAFQAPVYAGDFPDPSVLLVGKVYWAYGTGSAGRNLQVMQSSNLTSWTAPSDPLPTLPSWASTGLTWAPAVIQLAGSYVMYYTVRDTALAMQCISVATSATPAGPFVDHSTGPLICQTTDGGSIDPNPYRDPASGKLYLLWKSDDNSLGQNTHIWAQALAANGQAMAAGSTASLLLNESAAWQSPTVEGPTITSHSGRYYLFYGANNYDTASSAIGYATSGSLLGAYANQSVSGPWLATTGNAQGPQGPMIFTDASGTTRMAFAAWYGKVGYENGGARSLWVGTLSFNLVGKPALH